MVSLLLTIKVFIADASVANTMNDLGLSSQVIVSAINHDAKKPANQRSFFTDFGSLLNCWEDLANIYSLSGSLDGANLMDKFKDDSPRGFFGPYLNAHL